MGKMTVTCPHCDARYEIMSGLAGHYARCKECGQQFVLESDADLPLLVPLDESPQGGREPQAVPAAPIQADGSPIDGLDSGQMASTGRCSSCGQAMPTGSVLCIACGFNSATGKRVKTVVEPSGRLQPQVGNHSSVEPDERLRKTRQAARIRKALGMTGMSLALLYGLSYFRGWNGPCVHMAAVVLGLAVYLLARVEWGIDTARRAVRKSGYDRAPLDWVDCLILARRQRMLIFVVGFAFLCKGGALHALGHLHRGKSVSVSGRGGVGLRQRVAWSSCVVFQAAGSSVAGSSPRGRRSMTSRR